MEMRESLNLSVAAEPDSIGQATDSVLSNLVALGIPEDKRAAIGLAVQEALANAARHGCNNDPSKRIQCQVRHGEGDRILIVITDPGPGFDAPQSTPASLPDVYNDHGRGIFLIQQLMDEVQFDQGGTVIKMWKY
jgi:serine/threonine-protein kinase RsbW